MIPRGVAYMVASALGFSAMCLLNLEGKVFKRELNETFDVQDGLVNSEVQTERVETFESPPKKQPKRWFL